MATAIPPRTKLEVQAPLIQYASGRLEVKQASTGRFIAGHAGFHVEAGRDQSFDAWATGRNLPQLVARHGRSDGKPVEVTHWDLGSQIGFIALTNGPSTTAMPLPRRKDQTAALIASAIGLYWDTGNNGKSRSHLAVRGYLVLGEKDRDRGVYPRPLQLTATSLGTDELMRALGAHLGVCERADTLWGRGDDAQVNFFELVLPLRVSQDEVVRGKGTDTTAIVPLECAHPAPAEVDLRYLETVKVNEVVIGLVERDWPAALDWAAKFSDRAERAQGDGGDPDAALEAVQAEWEATQSRLGVAPGIQGGTGMSQGRSQPQGRVSPPAPSVPSQDLDFDDETPF